MDALFYILSARAKTGGLTLMLMSSSRKDSSRVLWYLHLEHWVMNRILPSN
jgi:hypothetical protein